VLLGLQGRERVPQTPTGARLDADRRGICCTIPLRSWHSQPFPHAVCWSRFVALRQDWRRHRWVQAECSTALLQWGCRAASGDSWAAQRY